MAASYQVSLIGSFPPEELEAVLQRCTLHAHQSKSLSWREIVFEPLGTTVVGRTDPSLVRIIARKDLNIQGGWTCYALSKPEPSRTDTTVRQATYMDIVSGNTLAFVSALGYQKVEEVRKHGWAFTRGNKVIIHIFKTDRVEDKELVRADPSSPWQVQVQTVPAPTPLQMQIDAVLEFKAVMKGLLDLMPYVPPPREAAR